MKLYSAALLLTLTALLTSQTAQAQFSTDSKLPSNISADDADYRPGLVILKGQVDVRQGDVRVLSETMRIHTKSQQATGGAGVIEGANKIEAIGSFYYLTPEQEVRGEKGVYLKSNETFTVTGNVILVQGDGNVVTGDKLVYDLDNGGVKVTGTCRGRRCGSKGRVNILLKSNNNNG